MTGAREKVLGHLHIILEQLTTASQTVVEFGQAEIPLLIREILNYALVSELLVAAFLIAVVIIVIKKFWPWSASHPKDSMDEEFGKMLVRVGLAITVPLAVGGAFSSLLTAAKVLVAPRLFLIEYLREIIK